jgi:hypothetical protein
VEKADTDFLFLVVFVGRIRKTLFSIKARVCAYDGAK